MSDHYDLIVIGGGSAGLTAAVFGGELGKRVVLIERERIGGDCTWTGCMPSKALIKIAKVAHAVRSAGAFGITTTAPVVDMPAVRDQIHAVIAEVYQHETPEAVARRGVQTIIGAAHFIDAQTVQVGDRRLTAKKFVIATGGRAAVPPIPGLSAVAYKTNANFFDNDRLPQHLLVLGGGPIGMEMAQAYVRLGAAVTVIAEQIMPRDEPEAVAAIRGVLTREGVTFHEGRVSAVRPLGGDSLALVLADGREVQGDMLLVAAGRTPNIDDLGLAAAGVSATPAGIPVNERLQTNVPHIYAVGDVTTGPKFTHYAGLQGAVAGRNLLLPIGKAKGLPTVVPWVTFTEPEVAHAGLTEAQAREQYGEAVKVFHFDLHHGDRTVAERDTAGLIKLVYRGGDLLGATVVAERAGEMITEYLFAITKRVSMRSLVSMIHPYPTYADVAKKAVSNLLVKDLLTSTGGKILKAVVKRLP